MTIEEKVGQLVQLSGEFVTGPSNKTVNVSEYVAAGKAGTVLNIFGVSAVKKMQQVAVEQSRLKIPLLFGYDVIHGYKTLFPVPLAQASSWDPELIRKASSVAAIEASASGVCWTFTPMLDIARDPRWGRVVEGNGEDPHLSSVLAKASIQAIQGNLSSKNSIMATAKHFVGYGEVQAGREYFTVDLSNRTLWEVYMPPFKAALDAGVASFMPSFTTMQGIPMSVNRNMLNNVLRKTWGFTGITVSDYNAIAECITHGVAANSSDAARQSISAGMDIDMMSFAYDENLEELVQNNVITMTVLDTAVKRVLNMKFELGLFDDPYKYCNETREAEEVMSDENIQASLEVARDSIVLLKNQNNILPLNINTTQKIAIVGPFAKDTLDPTGPWNARGMFVACATVYDGIVQQAKQATISFAAGSFIEHGTQKQIQEAVNISQQADIVIAVLGESRDMSGEAASRSDIRIPEAQRQLLQAVYAVNKQVILVLMNGRPLDLSWEDTNLPAIVEGWFLGNQAGNALADVIFGNHNPSGKLPITFPKSVGQIPIFYNHLMGGRPETPDNKDQKYVSKYLDIDNEPLYPFGYGLSFTNYSCSAVTLDKTQITSNENVTAFVSVTNTGPVDGYEIVQLYIRDLVASISRPVQELKDFQKVLIKAGQTVSINFSIGFDQLKFYNESMIEVVEPGEFQVMIGGSSASVQNATFEVIQSSEKKLSTGAIVGIVVGSVVGCLVIVIVVLQATKYRNECQKHKFEKIQSEEVGVEGEDEKFVADEKENNE